MKHPFDLSRKVALVTVAAAGIGLATATAFRRGRRGRRAPGFQRGGEDGRAEGFRINLERGLELAASMD